MNKKMNPKRKFLIERLGYFRSRAGLSARELSQRLGFSIAYIAKFENGDFNMPSEVLLDAIEICGTTPEEFFAVDLVNYQVNKQLIDNFKNLSNESKQTLNNLMKNLK